MADLLHQPYYSGFDLFSSNVEAQLMPDAIPQFIQGEEHDDAVVICLHGFTGVPYEVMPVAKAIAQLGISAAVPLLPGHGFRDRSVQEKEFSRITKEGILAAVRQEIARARERYRWVSMFGFSMGGAIALSMAEENLLDVCVVAAPAIRLPLRGEILIPLLSWASFTLPAPSKESFYLPGYDFHHSRALRTLWQLACHSRKYLDQIQCPLFGVHSHDDAVVPPVVLDMMKESIPGTIKTQWFDDSGHVMLLDKSGLQVASSIADFFRDQLI